jgi:8-amino-7-oxononanoate synthase
VDVRTDIASELRALEVRDLRRTRRTIAGRQGAEVEIDGRRVLCFASNDYLGLASDDRLVAASIAALERSGAGAGASPLVSGHMDAHEALEREIAGWLACEAALLFGSGYHANIGTIAALVGPEDEIFSDALNHASLIDGCRLARSRVSVYPHRDAGALGRLLEESRARRKLVITDSIFSMDGDAAPLEEIVTLAEAHGAWVMVDEAHATGVFGRDGAGFAAACGIGSRIAIRMGTLGKSRARARSSSGSSIAPEPTSTALRCRPRWSVPCVRRLRSRATMNRVGSGCGGTRAASMRASPPPGLRCRPWRALSSR